MSREPGSTSAQPTISVIICAFTAERLGAMEDALASLREQTLPAHEIVLVIDHAPALLEESRRRWPDLKVTPNRESRGLSGARNTGVEESTGEIVAFLDDDAVASPDWLARLAHAYAEPRVVGVGGAVRPRWLAGRPTWFPPEFDWVVGCSHSGMPAERSPVRNLVGANMSFRREALLETGGFRSELGRVGKIPAGCEETDLCIRINTARPKAEILYDPEASVDHTVPATRGTFRYFVERCRGEGRSKAVLTRLVGSGSGLSAERSYVRRTLPIGVLRGLGNTLAGRPGGAARAAAIVAGLATTTAGYVSAWGLATRRHSRQGQETDASDRLRILVVTPRNPLGQGGVERHVMEVGRRVAASGAEVEVLCGETGDGPLTSVTRAGVLIRAVRARPAGRDWFFAPGLWREMAKRPWDVVHVQSYHTLVAPLAMLRALTLGIPYVVTFHGGGHSSPMRNRMRRLQRLALRPLLARAARLVAVARFEIDAYSAELRLPRERFSLIPNGTETTLWDGKAGATPGDDGLLATIGRLERYKGHHRVIAALPYVLEKRPDARLLVVGTGPYESELRSQAAELGIADRVEFTSVPPGDPQGMAALLKRVSLVVLLSEFETHPLVALEAAAAGRPLLVADEGGLAEIAADGAARALPADETPRDVGAAIAEELDQPTELERPHLRSWDECAADLLGLYRSLA